MVYYEACPEDKPRVWELHGCMCHFPIWAGNDDFTRFCGERIERELRVNEAPYCEAHAAIAYMPTKARAA